ncbi:uncharacterized protein LOC142985831 [Anticarsia gemmatalis]|uniref:uncharacterized protein LOC142985831 n=1 Tax=Anticarsia gemmatalis TaxID=129554 RepID=UPI003F75F22F
MTSTANFDVPTLISELRQLRQEMSEIRQEIKEQSSHISKTIDERLAEYSNICQSKDIEIATLKASVSHLQQVVANQEQQLIKNDLEIIGIPEQDNENLTHIVLLTSQKMGIKLTEADVDEVARAGPKRPKVSELRSTEAKRPRPIVVKLLRRQKRDELVQAARSRRNVTTDNITPGPSQKIFVNERLTKANRNLFRDARLRSQKKGFRFCWVRHGGIFIKENENKQAIRILSSDDLDRILGPPPQSEPVSS